MTEDVSTKVKKMVADHIGVEESKVTEEANFIDDLGADSLDTVELVMAFEEEFGSEISDNEAEKILTVGDAIKFIEWSENALSELPEPNIKVSLQVEGTGRCARVYENR